MENLLANLREHYRSRICNGENLFVSLIDDRTTVTWKPLSVKDWLEYTDRFIDPNSVGALIENEVFLKSVVDPLIIRSFDRLKAGTVTLTVKDIMTYSGPSNPEELLNLVHQARELIRENVIHKMVSVIIRAFPAYKPDEIYEMDFIKFVFTFSLAENHLLSLGIIKEYIVFNSKSEEQAEQKPERKKIDTKKLSEEYKKLHKATPSSTKHRPPNLNVTPTEELQKVETDYQVTTAQKIEADKPVVISAQQMLYNMDMGEEASREVKAQEALIYKDYLDQVKRGERVKIKTLEERVAEAKERAEKNKQTFLARRKSKKKQ